MTLILEDSGAKLRVGGGRGFCIKSIERGRDLVKKVDVELAVDKDTKNTVKTYIFSKFVHICK